MVSAGCLLPAAALRGPTGAQIALFDGFSPRGIFLGLGPLPFLEGEETVRKALSIVTWTAVAAVGFLALWTFGVEKLTDRAFATSSSPLPEVSKPLAPGQKVTFLELGSVGCRPCEAMEPVMQTVRDKYGKRVEVTFHDVKKDPSIARKWRVVLIPTQIFLDPTGREVFRHEGFFALEEVEKVLQQMGLR